MSQHVFTYGSLMFAPVWQRVVAARHRSCAANLTGYRRFALADETYPGMIEAAGGSVTGVLYFDVNDADLRALDVFEGREYARRTVQVTTPAQEQVMAQTYVFLVPALLAAHDWEPAAFPIDRFMRTYCSGRLSDAVPAGENEPV